VQQQQTPQSAMQSMTRRSGWIEFAGVMTILTGAFNLFDGLVAYYRASYFRNLFIYGNLRFWAWVFIAFAVLQFLAGFAILARQEWGRWFGIVTVVVNLFAQLFVISANPWWSTIIILYDLAIFYALAVRWHPRPVAA
jgi:uncharacterized membrane protein HdeD (DUF308 family)